MKLKKVTGIWVCTKCTAASEVYVVPHNICYSRLCIKLIMKVNTEVWETGIMLSESAYRVY